MDIPVQCLIPACKYHCKLRIQRTKFRQKKSIDYHYIQILSNIFEGEQKLRRMFMICLRKTLTRLMGDLQEHH